MRTKENYGWLDRFRLPAALFVITIHTSPLASFSSEADFFLTRILARTAVPFFFMVTGQFVAAPFIRQNRSKPTTGKTKRQELHRLWRYLRKILLLYTAAILLYLPIGIYAGHYQEMTFGTALRMLFFDGTFYHLWYFPACLLGVGLVYLLSRFLKLQGILAVSAVLYAIGLLGDSYYGLVQQLPALEAVYGVLFRFSSYTRNGLFFAPLFLALGAWCKTMAGDDTITRAPGEKSGHRRNSLSINLGGLLLSFLLMTAEAFTLRHFSWQRHDSMYLMLVPVMIFLYRTLLGLSAVSGKSNRPFRSASLWIYLLHPAFIVVVRAAAKLLHLTPLLVDNSLLHFLAVTALSVCAGFCMAFVQAKFVAASAAKTGAHHRPHSPASTPCGRAWIELDRGALARNTAYLTSILPEGCRLMPAVKANAYGHGAALIAGELNRLGVDSFCVACLSEGISLRNSGVKGEILILGYTAPKDFPQLVRYRLTQTVIDFEYAEKLAASGLKLHVHIGIDTGMHRLGIRCENIEEILSVFEMKNLKPDGMLTHLCVCDSPSPENRAFTESQIQAFYSVVEILQAQGISCPKLHLQSSYGLLNYPDLNADYVRAGIALYGVPSAVKDTDFFRENLTPVLSLKARVASVRTLYAGDSAGYGLAFTAEEDMQIAVLSIGYADGLPRELSCGRGYVLLHGCQAPIIGRICMDQTLVDISGIPDVSAGDTAVLIGTSGEAEITAQQLASQCGTITNELLSRLGERLERIFI